jgi:hypothetical protein
VPKEFLFCGRAVERWDNEHTIGPEFLGFAAVTHHVPGTLGAATDEYRNAFVYLIDDNFGDPAPFGVAEGQEFAVSSSIDCPSAENGVTVTVNVPLNEGTLIDRDAEWP